MNHPTIDKNLTKRKRSAWIISILLTFGVFLFLVFVQYPQQAKNREETDNTAFKELSARLAKIDTQFKQSAENAMIAKEQIQKDNDNLLRDPNVVAEQIESLNGRVTSTTRIQDSIMLSVSGFIPDEENQQIQLIFVIENQSRDLDVRFPAMTKSSLSLDNVEFIPTGYAGRTEELVNSPLKPGNIFSGSIIFDWADIYKAGRFTTTVELGDDIESDFSFEWTAAEEVINPDTPNTEDTEEE